MATQLRFVDPNLERTWFSRAYAAFSSTRLGRFLSAQVVWKIDPYLLRATRSRVGLILPNAREPGGGGYVGLEASGG